MPAHGGAEPVERIRREDVLASGEELVDHRIVLGDELDDQPRREVGEEGRDALKRQIAPDRQVVDESQCEDDVGVGALEQGPTLHVGPAQSWTWIARSTSKGNVVVVALAAKEPVVALRGCRVDVPCDDATTKSGGDPC